MKKLNIPNTDKKLYVLPPFVYTSDAELDDLKKDVAKEYKVFQVTTSQKFPSKISNEIVEEATFIVENY